MKMRKALSFVLVLALVLGSFSMAFAATPINQGSDLSDIADSANYDAIVANSDLGIITGYEDGSFKPENNVNRAEFAAMITRMMGVPESALGGYSATAFTDMSGYGWAASYVGFCAAKGIVNGYGDGTFGPGNTITVNEAITMVARAIGYVNNSSELVGNWPANYVTLGKRIGLYDDVTSVATIDRENAAQVIYNALTCVVVAVNADGDTDPAYTYVDDNKNVVAKTVLEVYLDCTPTGWMVYTDTEANASVINTLQYVGAYVKAFENSDEEVVAIAEVGSTFLTGKVKEKDADVFKAGGVEYKLTDGETAYVDVDKKDQNAVYFANGIEKGTETDVVHGDGTLTLAVKLSGKTIKEVYSVNAWAAADTFQFEADMLEDDALNGYNFALDDNDAIDAKAFTLLGVDSLDKIAEDNVVKVYLEDNSKVSSDIVKVTVGTEVVEGKVTLKDGTDFTIDGKVYAGPADINLGDTITAYLDYDGDIAFYDVKDAAADNYAIVTGKYVADARDGGTIILLDKEGNEKEYDVKEGVTDAEALNGGTEEDPVEVKGTLVTFGLDKNGKINKFTDLTKDPNYDGDVDGQLSANRTIFADTRVDAGVVVFAEDDSDYSVVSINDIETKANIDDAKTYAKDGKIKVIILDASHTGADSVYAVLNFVKNAYNDNDDEVQLVKGFEAGKAYEAYTDGELDGLADDGKDFVEKIAIAKLSVDSNGIITKASKVTNTDLKTDIVNGTVIYKSSANRNLQLDNNKYYAIDPKAVVYIADSAADDFYSVGTFNSIVAQDGVRVVGSHVHLYQLDDDSEVYDVVIIDKTYVADATGDMALALTTPAADASNTIAVGGANKTGNVNVVNGTASVVITGTKTADQVVEVDGTHSTSVTAAGTDTAPTFTVNTSDIAEAGGSKTFTLTVKEPGKSQIVYTVTVVVAP